MIFNLDLIFINAFYIKSLLNYRIIMTEKDLFYVITIY